MIAHEKFKSLSSFDFFDRESSSESKVDALLSANRYDTCGPAVDSSLGGLYRARTSGKGCILFKTLYTNACRFDCKYCINTRKGQKSSYNPEELAKTFISLYNSGIVEGLFLSSAIPSDPEIVMEKMIETLEIIRYRYWFRDYIHQKILPGSSYDSLKRASKLADRLSINVEAPSKSRLSCLSGTKDYLTNIIRRQRWLKRMEMPGGLNCATMEELLHVPGIGEIGAKRIIARRKEMRITRKRELAELGVVVKRAEAFLKIDGWSQKRIDGF